MKNTIIAVSLIASVGFASFLTYKFDQDIKTGKYPTSFITKNIGNVEISYQGYNTTQLPLSILKYVIDIPKDTKQSFKFNYTHHEKDYSKNVYSIKGDSYALSYKFEDPNKHSINKDIKSKFFKMSSNFFDKTGVKRIYRSNTSSIAQISYIVEFEKEQSISDLYRYTSHFLTNDENISNTSKELEFLSKYVDLSTKYKKLNLVFSNNDQGFVLRNLVSKRLDDNKPQKSEYRVVYKK